MITTQRIQNEIKQWKKEHIFLTKCAKEQEENIKIFKKNIIRLKV